MITKPMQAMLDEIKQQAQETTDGLVGFTWENMAATLETKGVQVLANDIHGMLLALRDEGKVDIRQGGVTLTQAIQVRPL